MIDVLHIELDDKDMMTLKEGKSVDFDFDNGELNNIMQIVIQKAMEE